MTRDFRLDCQRFQIELSGYMVYVKVMLHGTIRNDDF